MRATLLREMKVTVWSMRLSATREATSTERKLRASLRLFCGSVAICACVTTLHAQSSGPVRSGSSANDIQAMQERISNLETEVAELKAMIKQLHPAAASTAAAATPAVLASAVSATVNSPVPGDESQFNRRIARPYYRPQTKRLWNFFAAQRSIWDWTPTTRTTSIILLAV